ncbi:hypothetical protein BpHYR1_031996 [Brachionus plicatilis]|uniref:Uncharacterized protein n=1 Tax=Brachionus plicatilis TaxID=10195 RepID=A0A3M7SGP0_BRAPC|nr:hypothetical protein BpHYR1_031996 [Brachionus plicatilis]
MLSPTLLSSLSVPIILSKPCLFTASSARPFTWGYSNEEFLFAPELETKWNCLQPFLAATVAVLLT